jgi:hypothetical protein
VQGADARRGQLGGDGALEAGVAGDQKFKRAGGDGGRFVFGARPLLPLLLLLLLAEERQQRAR